LVSRTDSVNVWLADITGEPLSWTVTIIVCDVPPSDSPGVPVITPVSELMEAQPGRPEALKVKVFVGISLSLADGVVDVKAVCSEAV
jgi:hypothetical protein